MTDRELLEHDMRDCDARCLSKQPEQEPEKLPMVEIETVLTVQPEVQRTHWEGCEEVHPECRKPEAVAWHEPGAYGNVTVYKKWANDNGWLPLYAAPPQRKWQGLTDEEIDDAQCAVDCRLYRSYARAIEAKLKEKNA